MKQPGFPWKVRGFFLPAHLVVLRFFFLSCADCDEQMHNGWPFFPTEWREKWATSWVGLTLWFWVSGGDGVGINVEYIYKWYDLAWSDLWNKSSNLGFLRLFLSNQRNGSWVTGNHGCSLLTCTTWDTEQKVGVIGVVFTVFTFWICFNICQTCSNEDVGEWDWKTQLNEFISGQCWSSLSWAYFPTFDNSICPGKFLVNHHLPLALRG